MPDLGTPIDAITPGRTSTPDGPTPTPIPMSEHDEYVAKINWLIETGHDELVDEVAEQYRPAC